MDKRLIWLAVGAFATSPMASSSPACCRHRGMPPAFPFRRRHLITAFSLAYAVGTPILATLTGAADRRRVILWSLAVLRRQSGGGRQRSFATAARRPSSWARPRACSRRPRRRRRSRWSVSTIARAVAIVVGGTTVAVALGAPLGALVGSLPAGAAPSSPSPRWRWSARSCGTAAARHARHKAAAGAERAALASGHDAVARGHVLYLTGAFISFAYMAPLASGRRPAVTALPGCCSPSASAPSSATMPAASSPTGSARRA